MNINFIADGKTCVAHPVAGAGVTTPAFCLPGAVTAVGKLVIFTQHDVGA